MDGSRDAPDARANNDYVFCCHDLIYFISLRGFETR
jgi:hypothetical protein